MKCEHWKLTYRSNGDVLVETSRRYFIEFLASKINCKHMYIADCGGVFCGFCGCEVEVKGETVGQEAG